MKNEPRSNCCDAPTIDTNGGGDFGAVDEGTTWWSECTKCKNPCDPKKTMLNEEIKSTSVEYKCTCSPFGLKKDCLCFPQWCDKCRNKRQKTVKEKIVRDQLYNMTLDNAAKMAYPFLQISLEKDCKCTCHQSADKGTALEYWHCEKCLCICTPCQERAKSPQGKEKLLVQCDGCPGGLYSNGQNEHDGNCIINNQGGTPKRSPFSPQPDLTLPQKEDQPLQEERINNSATHTADNCECRFITTRQCKIDLLLQKERERCAEIVEKMKWQTSGGLDFEIIKRECNGTLEKAKQAILSLNEK